VGTAESAHLPGLMGAHRQIRTGFPGARQHESCVAIFGEVAYGIGLVHLTTVHHSGRAREAASLMTQSGQDNTCVVRRVPDVIHGRHLDGAFTLRRDESDSKCGGSLRIRGHVSILGDKLSLGPAWLRGSQAGIRFGDHPRTRTRCRTTSSCCREHVRARRGGSDPTGWTCHRAQTRAVR
jgi:hypothetical protein